MHVPLLRTPSGLESIPSSASIPRHRHEQAYVAVVISGSYQESGDEGRFEVAAGDALVHSPFQGHRDHVSISGATVLNLPCPRELEQARRLEVQDVDALAVAAERDVREALIILATNSCTSERELSDWPDLLALRLRNLEPFRLADWASSRGLAPETVSRGFARAYGVTPQRYRAEARTRRALVAIGSGRGSLVAVALRHGFSDQAHMTRAVRTLTGRTRGHWRRVRASSVTCQSFIASESAGQR